MTKLATRSLSFAAAAILALAGCNQGGPAAPSPTGGRLTVVATTTVLADLARQVGGDRTEVHSLVPAGGEVHTFEPAPSDLARLSRASVLVMNGLGLDDWLLKLAREGGASDVAVVELAEDLDGVDYIEGGDDHGEVGEENEADADHADSAEGEHSINPHLWLDASIAARYVDRLAEVLTQADPAGGPAYEANAAAYRQRLAELDSWIRSQLAGIAESDRRVISFHDAFPYFAAAYDLEIVGVVVDAPGQEPSAAEVAALIAAIRGAGVKAILAEAQFSERLARAIADESGAVVVSGLYTDSLGDPPADSYEAAMRWNTEQIVGALR